MITGGRYAFQVAHPASPMLRVRYRDGVPVGPHGFPDWLPYARALVQLPPAGPDLGVDESRVLDVLSANAAAAAAGDPLWAGLAPLATPPGWVWALLAGGRRIALVPAELHGAYRHHGGVSTGDADPARRGLAVNRGAPPAIRFTERLSEEAVAVLEERLGHPLPPGYREFLRRTNGGAPAAPAVHPRFGFVVDQPLLGLAREDRLQDLAYANAWFGDRFTADWLAVGYVQGGLLAVRVRGGDEGSVWYWDDDDPRATDEDTAADVCGRLLHRCADDFVAFWYSLVPPPAVLRARAAEGGARLVRAPGMGASLPAARRPPAVASTAASAAAAAAVPTPRTGRR